MKKMLDENITKQYSKIDEPMNEAATSSSTPPPPPPGAPLTTRGRRGRKKKEPEEAAAPLPANQERSRSRNIILKPSDEEELKNSQPGRAKKVTSNEPKRRGIPVEVKPATSGIGIEEPGK